MRGQVILKNLQWLGKHNPAFTPGSVQTAVAELLNPTSSILPYSARLCLSKPAIVCTGTILFNIDAGATKNVNFQILMPTAEGTYPVHLDIFSNSELLEAYRADEDVVVSLLKYTLEVAIEPPGAGYVVKSPVKATYSAGELVTLTAHPYSGYEFDHWGGWPPYPGVGSTSPSIPITMDADWWVVAAFREAVPVKVVTVRLKNPPSRGNYWQLVLFNKVWGDSVRVGKHIPVGEAMTLETRPAGWTFPLYIDIMVYELNVSPYNIVYEVQSAYGQDWPDYKNITIPNYGSFYYNVATGKIEKITVI